MNIKNIQDFMATSTFKRNEQEVTVSISILKDGVTVENVTPDLLEEAEIEHLRQLAALYYERLRSTR